MDLLRASEMETDRIQAYLITLTKDFEKLVKYNATWSDQKYCLGKIEGVRAALRLMSDTNSTIPSNLIA